MVPDMGDQQDRGIQTVVVDVPITLARPPYNPTPDEERILPNAGTARANRAATLCAPDGTSDWADDHVQQTVLQQHCEFFDPDKDGVVWPLDTFRGFYALGFGFLLSVFAMFLVHVNFSYPTCPGWVPDPFFRVYLDNIHKAKHGSDTGTYDNEGRFVPQNFENFFSKYSKGKDGVTLGDVADALKGQRVIMDPIGWFAAWFEWLATYIMLWPDDGVMQKEDVRRVYDGSIFVVIASKRAGTAKTKAA